MIESSVYLVVFAKTIAAPQLTKNFFLSLIKVLIIMNKLTLANLIFQTSIPVRDHSQQDTLSTDLFKVFYKIP